MIETYKSIGLKKGAIVQTAASSALGRQINRLAIREGIPILNYVRRQEQVDLLKSDGATHVYITEGNWQEEFKNFTKQYDGVVVYDFLGGG